MILDRSAYFLLGQLEDKGDQMISALANTFLLDISTVSRQIAALETKGFVKRIPHPQHVRMNLLQITDEGRKLYTEMRNNQVSRYKGVLADWSDEDKQALGAWLIRLNDSIHALGSNNAKNL